VQLCCVRCFWVDIYFNSNRKTWVSLTPQGRDMMSPLLSAHHPLPFVDTTSLPPSRLVQAHGMKSPACRPPSADNSYLVYPSPVPAAPAPIPISPQIPLLSRFPHVQRRARSTTPTPSPTTPVKGHFPVFLFDQNHHHLRHCRFPKVWGTSGLY
jgi:hypothetical protein